MAAEPVIFAMAVILLMVSATVVWRAVMMPRSFYVTTIIMLPVTKDAVSKTAAMPLMKKHWIHYGIGLKPEPAY